MPGVLSPWSSLNFTFSWPFDFFWTTGSKSFIVFFVNSFFSSLPNYVDFILTSSGFKSQVTVPLVGDLPYWKKSLTLSFTLENFIKFGQFISALFFPLILNFDMQPYFLRPSPAYFARLRVRIFNHPLLFEFLNRSRPSAMSVFLLFRGRLGSQSRSCNFVSSI